MHNAKPLVITITENTTSGNSVEINVSDPIYEAVSKQARPQIVQDNCSNLRFCGATSSAVLDSKRVSDNATKNFTVKFATSTRIIYLFKISGKRRKK